MHNKSDRENAYNLSIQTNKKDIALLFEERKCNIFTNHDDIFKKKGYNYRLYIMFPSIFLLKIFLGFLISVDTIFIQVIILIFMNILDLIGFSVFIAFQTDIKNISYINKNDLEIDSFIKVK